MTHRSEAKHVFANLGSDKLPDGEAVSTNNYSDHTYIVGLEKVEKMLLFLRNTHGSAGLHYRIDYSPGKYINTGNNNAIENYWIEHTTEATLLASTTKLDFDFSTPYDGAMKLRIQLKSALADTPATFRMYATARGTY